MQYLTVIVSTLLWSGSLPSARTQAPTKLEPPPASAAVAWEGRGHYRLRVKVEPVELDTRASDELVASCDLDLGATASTLPKGRAIDFDSVQVMRSVRPATSMAAWWTGTATGCRTCSSARQTGT